MRSFGIIKNIVREKSNVLFILSKDQKSLYEVNILPNNIYVFFLVNRLKIKRTPVKLSFIVSNTLR